MAPPFFPFSTALVVAMLAMASLPYALTDVLIPPPMDDYPDFLDMVPPPDPPPFDAPPEETTVVCKTTQGPITIAVRPDWSPLGAQRWGRYPLPLPQILGADCRRVLHRHATLPSPPLYPRFLELVADGFFTDMLLYR